MSVPVRALSGHLGIEASVDFNVSCTVQEDQEILTLTSSGVTLTIQRWSEKAPARFISLHPMIGGSSRGVGMLVNREEAVWIGFEGPRLSRPAGFASTWTTANIPRRLCCVPAGEENSSLVSEVTASIVFSVTICKCWDFILPQTRP